MRRRQPSSFTSSPRSKGHFLSKYCAASNVSKSNRKFASWRSSTSHAVNHIFKPRRREPTPLTGRVLERDIGDDGREVDSFGVGALVRTGILEHLESIAHLASQCPAAGPLHHPLRW
ncbi:hypothetical protein D9613_001272 [Agrocybe pediades]|uniref:Uncharacterized protein n=1 Tax=Agrocybe pediades TaxID=84607 RepID=A0A8H4VUA1_9AGAR|nr:hypothetical protein D9613_001272 [Agrocybe pediades]